MTYMAKVAKMLGVELGERFRDGWYEKRRGKEPRIVINSSGFGGYWEHEITKDGIITYGTDENGNIVRTEDGKEMLCRLLTGKRILIKKRQWKPKANEQYHYVGIEGQIERGHWISNSIDTALYVFGNCFRTAAEAEAHKDEILAKMKEVLEG